MFLISKISNTDSSYIFVVILANCRSGGIENTEKDLAVDAGQFVFRYTLHFHAIIIVDFLFFILSFIINVVILRFFFN